MPEELKLLPCPFCGFERPCLIELGRKTWQVECANCNAATRDFSEDQKIKAVRLWNSRPLEQQKPSAEKLRELAAARRTLVNKGYTYHGGNFWKLPAGGDEKQAKLDSLRARLEAAVELIDSLDNREHVVGNHNDYSSENAFIYDWNLATIKVSKARAKWEALNGSAQ